jgi:hypothetical protein
MKVNFRLMPLTFGSALLLYGLVQLLWGWYYADIAKREGTTEGIIRRVYSGTRSTTYEYTFQLDGIVIRDDDNQCETALDRGACKVGTRVLVYYDESNPARTLLNEYGAESRRDLHLGIWMTPTGLILLLWFYIELRTWRRSHLEEGSDDTPDESDSGIIHVVPDE